MWAFSFKGRVEIVDFALQLGENPYYEMEKIRQLMSEVDPMAWIIGINQILSLVEKIRSLVKKKDSCK